MPGVETLKRLFKGSTPGTKIALHTLKPYLSGSLSNPLKYGFKVGKAIFLVRL